MYISRAPIPLERNGKIYYFYLAKSKHGGFSKTPKTALSLHFLREPYRKTVKEIEKIVYDSCNMESFSKLQQVVRKIGCGKSPWRKWQVSLPILCSERIVGSCVAAVKVSN